MTLRSLGDSLKAVPAQLSRSKRLQREVSMLREELEEARQRARDAAAETAWLLELGAGALRGEGPEPRRLASVLEILGRLSGGSQKLDRQPIAVAGPLAEVISEYRRTAARRHGRPEEGFGDADDDPEIIYIEDGGGDWLTASIDRALFIRAMRELLDNCLAHAENWGRITVTSEPVPGAILVRVRDDGCGIAPRGGPASRTGTGPDIPSEIPTKCILVPGAGNGLGLFLVRRIVEAHGGELAISTHPGYGTSVSTRWPTPGGAIEDRTG